MKEIAVIKDFQELFARQKAATTPAWHKYYYAMYSSLLDSIVTDPDFMLIPISDHLAQRGDGVFETLKCVSGNIYNLKDHLERLEYSAKSIALALPYTRQELGELIIGTVRASNKPDCSIRVILSRGPGGLSVDPYECPQPAIYIFTGPQKPPFMTLHPQGAKVASTAINGKSPFFSTIKTCNYIPNAMMKKEAVDAGVDFTVGFDENGYMTEGAAENFAIITRDGWLTLPKPGRILEGTTQKRALVLAQELIASGDLVGVTRRDITHTEAAAASEMLIFGTTPNVAAATIFDGKAIGSGLPGNWYKKLAALLDADIMAGNFVRTAVFA